MKTSVLYDAPGPRARRVTLVASLVATVMIAAAAYLFIYRPLDRQGQFTMEKWGPLIDPGNESFVPLWKRLGQGFTATLLAAALAIVSSLVLGTGLAVLRVQLRALLQRRFTGLASSLRYGVVGLSWLLNGVTRVFVEVFRGLPVVITIYFVYSALPRLGLDLGEILWYLVIGLTLYNMVVIGEILRSGMQGLPGGQGEAAASLGLSSFQTTRIVLLPQAFRIMLPALIGQLVVILKDTSLGFIISYEEILRVSGQTIQSLNNPIQTYVVVGAIYIGVNYALSRLAVWVERRIARGRRSPGPAPAPPPSTMVTAVTPQESHI
jgi:glutamate transport system permease protein